MRQRLTYANVVGTIVLIAALVGGTAAALPGKKTVQANDFRKNSVKAAAIAAKAVRSAEIKDGVVGGDEVADGSLQYADLGANGIVARIRLAEPVSSEGATELSPKGVPLTGNSWAQLGNETQVFFADARFTQPGSCGNNGSLAIEIDLDGEPFEVEFLNADTPPATESVPVFADRPYLFEPGSAVNHTVTMRLYDDCQNAGENLTLESFDVNVIAMR